MLRKKLIIIFLINSCFLATSAYAGEEKQLSPANNKYFWSDWFGSKNVESVKQEKPILPAQVSNKKPAIKSLFSESERDDIRRFYRQNEAKQARGKKSKHKHKNKHAAKQLPYGLQKKLARGGQLPPGWQKKVAQGDVLSREMLSHSKYLPAELARHLPAHEDGIAIRRVGDKVVRVLEGNGTVLDVIDLADILLR